MSPTELLERPSLQESLIVPENLEQRVADALEVCEVQATPEVREAVEGYYSDHYTLAGVIEKVCDGSLTEEEADGILEVEGGTIATDKFDAMITSGSLNVPSAETAVRLLAFACKAEMHAGTDESRKVLKQVVGHSLSSVLFQEESLGITTITDNELSAVEALYAKFSDSFGEDSESSSKNASIAITEIQRKKEALWDDCRSAGQLEFHNSGFLAGISRSGGMMSRNEQYRRNGEIRHQTTIESIHHSGGLHSKEGFFPNAYITGSEAGRETPDDGKGTIATPLGYIIEQAPYARDAKNAMVRVKSETTLEKIPVPTRIINDFQGETTDVPGPTGPDRVFFASATETDGVIPDEYVIPLNNLSTLIFIGKEQISSSERYGIGEGFPAHLLIEDATDTAAVESSIMELQQQNLDKYKGWVVVPLRRGVFEFVPENMPVRDREYRKEAKYNINPLV